MKIKKKELLKIIESFLFEEDEDKFKNSKPEELNALMSDENINDMLENAFEISHDKVLEMVTDQDASLLFNGNKLKWIGSGGKEVYSWDASTSKDFSKKEMYSSQYKNPRETMKIPKKGATPEGLYQLGETEVRGKGIKPWITGMYKTVSSAIGGRLGIGRTAWHWNANTQVSKDAWGDFRFPLKPERGTDMFGRTDMYLHGGKSPGSAGCIDTTVNISEIARLIIAWRYWNSLGEKDQELASGKKVRFPNRTVPMKLEVNYDDWEPLESKSDD